MTWILRKKTKEKEAEKEAAKERNLFRRPIIYNYTVYVSGHVHPPPRTGVRSDRANGEVRMQAKLFRAAPKQTKLSRWG